MITIISYPIDKGLIFFRSLIDVNGHKKRVNIDSQIS